MSDITPSALIGAMKTALADIPASKAIPTKDLRERMEHLLGCADPAIPQFLGSSALSTLFTGLRTVPQDINAKRWFCPYVPAQYGYPKMLQYAADAIEAAARKAPTLAEVRSELRRIEQAVCLRLDRIENKLDRLLQGCYTE